MFFLMEKPYFLMDDLGGVYPTILLETSLFVTWFDTILKPNPPRPEAWTCRGPADAEPGAGAWTCAESVEFSETPFPGETPKHLTGETLKNTAFLRDVEEIQNLAFDKCHRSVHISIWKTFFAQLKSSFCKGRAIDLARSGEKQQL